MLTNNAICLDFFVYETEKCLDTWVLNVSVFFKDLFFLVLKVNNQKKAVTTIILVLVLLSKHNRPINNTDCYILEFFSMSQRFFNEIYHGLDLYIHSTDKLAKDFYELILEASLNSISRIQST